MNKIRVRKRGSTYYFSFEAGKKADGKRRTIEHGGYDDEQSAYDAGVKAYTDWKHGEIGITSERVTVSEYLDSYMAIRKQELRRGTLQTYWTAVRRIQGFIGGVVLQDLRPREIDGMLRTLVRNGLSKHTVIQTRMMLKIALDYAVYPAELISSNPAASLKIPRGAREHVIERTVVGQELLSELLARWPESHYMHIYVLLAYHTGMRGGEICGLTWDDIDFESGRLRVERQIIRAENFVGFGPPKTPTSEREIYLDRKILAALKKWKSIQSMQRMSAGHKYLLVFRGKDDAIEIESRNTTRQGAVPLVVTRGDGLYQTTNKINLQLEKVHLNSHSFRHTHTTILAEDASVSPKALAARLGHKNIETTQNVYTHVTDKMREDTRNSFEKMLENAR